MIKMRLGTGKKNLNKLIIKKIEFVRFSSQFLFTNITYAPWEAKSNKTIDFLYKKFVFKHFFSAEILFSSSLLSNKHRKSKTIFHNNTYPIIGM